jgi:hypothetical protein
MLLNPAIAVDEFHLVNDIPDFTPEGTRIHRQSTTDRAGYTGKKLCTGKTRLCAKSSYLGTSRTSLSNHPAIFQLCQPRQTPMTTDHCTAESGIPHKQVRTQPDPQQGRLRRNHLEKLREVTSVAGAKIIVCGSTNPPTGMLCHQLMASNFSPNSWKIAL